MSNDPTPPPFLVHFPNGWPTEDQASSLQFKAYNSAGKNKRKQDQMLVAENSSMLYRATNEARSLPCRFVVGVFNKEDGQLQLYPSYNVFGLRQEVKNYDGKIVDSREKKTAYDDSRKRLVETFGARKRQLQIKSEEAGRVSGESLESKAVANTIADTIRAQTTNDMARNEIEMMTDENRPVPPFQREAIEAADIYPVDDMISAEEMEAMDPKELLQASKKDGLVAQLKETNNYPQFVIERLTSLRAVEKAERPRIAKLLLYITYLWRLYGMHDVKMGTRSHVERALDAPPVVVDKLLSTFAAPDSESSGAAEPRYTKPKREKDLLVSYICVLCLTVEQFNIDPAVLAADLALTSIMIGKYLRGVGCKSSGKRKRDDNSDLEDMEGVQAQEVLTLSAPLTFPRPKRGRKSGKR